MEDETLAPREADPERPAVPLHEVPRDGEARAFRLRDLERPQRGALLDVARPVLARAGRDGHDAVVDDLEDLAAVEVDQADDALERPRVRVAVRVGAHPRECAAEAPAGIR